MSHLNYIPSYTISNKIVNLVSKMTVILTKISLSEDLNHDSKLRRENRIKTIQATLAIENNTLLDVRFI